MVESNAVTETGEKAVKSNSQKMSAALSAYARVLTFENRSRRNLYRLAGLAPRRRDQVFSALLFLAFLFCFAIPFTASSIYFGFIASPIYSSEVQFVVRSSAPLLSRSRYSSEHVEPRAKIVQDTAVLLNYLDSPAMIADLEDQIDLNLMFGRSDIDLISRLGSEVSRSDIKDYWEGKYSAEVNPKSGIVKLEVKAFSPEESYDLLKTVLTLAEQRVNKLNSSMWGDLMTSAENDVESSKTNLIALREEYRQLQNQTGVFNIEMSADGLQDVLSKLETETVEMRSVRDAMRKVVGENSPRLAELDRQVTAREEQLSALKQRIAGSGSQSLADVGQAFRKMELETEMAENRLESAIKELEKVKLVSSLQLVYIDVFTEPTVPDTSRYPKVPLNLLLSFLLLVTIWGMVSGLIAIIRHKLD